MPRYAVKDPVPHQETTGVRQPEHALLATRMIEPFYFTWKVNLLLLKVLFHLESQFTTLVFFLR